MGHSGVLKPNNTVAELLDELREYSSHCHSTGGVRGLEGSSDCCARIL